jgi:outer membrane protein TolC
MMKPIKLLFSTAAIGCSILSMGQDPVGISQEELLQKVSNANLQMKIAQRSFESARADYRQSNALYLPNINAAHTAMTTTNPLMAFGSKLNQERLTAADFNPTLLNDPAKTNNYATKLEILQPIVNVDGLFERQAAKAKMESFALQTERTKEYLMLEATKAYMQLQLAYKALTVLEKAKETAAAHLKLVQEYYRQGMLQKPDLLSVELRVNEIANQLQYASSNVRNASDYIAFLINEDNKQLVFKPTTDLDNQIKEQSLGLSFSENRKDILAMDKASDAYLKMFRSAKMKFLPRLNAFGSYELYDTRLFNMDAKGYTLGAQLSWNLFDGYKSIAKMEKARIDYQKASVEAEQYTAQSRLEWNKTHRQLQDAENKVSLASLGLEQAQEAYKIRLNRYKQGLEKTSDLLTTEAQMLQKEMEQLQAVFEYNFTQKYLQFLSK